MTVGGAADNPQEALPSAASLNASREPGVDALARSVQVALGARTTMLALVDPERLVVISSVEAPGPGGARLATPLSHSYCRRVAEEREPLVVDDSRDHRGQGERRTVEDVDAIAWIGVPLLADEGHAIGTLCAITAAPRAWEPRELELLQALAETAVVMMSARAAARDANEARAAVDAHVAERRRIEAELRRERENRAAELQHLALRLQQGLLPRLHVASASVRVLSLYEPGEQRMLLGGDFLDVYEHPDGALSLLVGDVSGHGPDAASFAVGVRAAWRALLLTGTSPARVLSALNDIAHSERADPEIFATVCHCSIVPARDQLIWASAGHPPPLVVDQETRELVGRIGPPLGVVDQADWAPTRTALSSDVAVMLYTDGLTEGRRAPGADARYGRDALIRAIDVVRTRMPLDQAGLRAIVGDVRQANGAPLPDDVAILLTILSPGPAPRPAASSATREA